MSEARRLRRLMRREADYALGLERRALSTGEWPPWREGPLPPKRDSGGWLNEVNCTYSNNVFAVLIRPVPTAWGTVMHAAIRNVSSTDVGWRHKQRIKNELFGPEAVAVEVFPPDGELVDEVEMYHLWVLPPGFALPFTLANGGHRA